TTTGSTTLPASSLVITLLSVAARDNSTAGLSTGDNLNRALATVAFVETRPTIQSSVAAPGGSDDGLTISGTAVDAVNGDGNQQLDEPGLPGETVVLEVVRKGETVTVTTITDASGHYRFTNLEPGEYHVSLRPKAGPPDSSSNPTRVLVRIAIPGISP